MLLSSLVVYIYSRVHINYALQWQFNVGTEHSFSGRYQWRQTYINVPINALRNFLAKSCQDLVPNSCVEEFVKTIPPTRQARLSAKGRGTLLLVWGKRFNKQVLAILGKKNFLGCHFGIFYATLLLKSHSSCP